MVLLCIAQVHNSLTQNQNKLKFWILVTYVDIYSFMTLKDDAKIREYTFKVHFVDHSLAPHPTLFSKKLTFLHQWKPHIMQYYLASPFTWQIMIDYVQSGC